MDVGPCIASWQEAERLAADWMRGHGFPDATVSKSGADGGIDVFARRAIAQVKYQARSVDRPALQRLVGARGSDVNKQLLFFTSSSYSATALQYAEGMSIAVFIYGVDGMVTPENREAEALAVKGRARRAWRGLSRIVKETSGYPGRTPDGLAGSNRQHTSISVTVTGGIAGIRRSGSVTRDDARWAEAERLLSTIDRPKSGLELNTPTQMDGLAYVFVVDGTSHVLADWQLTPALERLAALVLDV